MKLIHKTPCKQCPWRKDSLQGWLGPNDPYAYADVVQMNGVTQCHLTLGAPPTKRAICVGSLCTSANSCTQVRTMEGVEEKKAGLSADDKAACFQFPQQFYTYHSHGKAYQHPFLRNLPLKEDE